MARGEDELFYWGEGGWEVRSVSGVVVIHADSDGAFTVELDCGSIV